MRSIAFIRSKGSVVASMLLLSLFGVGMALTTRDPAIANTVMDQSIESSAVANAGDGDGDGDHMDAPPVPKPVVGDELFVGQSGTNSCSNRDAVVGQFLRDENEIGGRVFSMAEGMDQRFSDVWRASVGVEEITISGIVTHIFFDRVADEWTADVVELDKTGCAISRTLLTGNAFNALLATLARQEERFRAGYEASNETSSPTFESEQTLSDRRMHGSFEAGSAAAGVALPTPAAATVKKKAWSATRRYHFKK